jgi:hypothetical protein
MKVAQMRKKLIKALKANAILIIYLTKDRHHTQEKHAPDFAKYCPEMHAPGYP